MGAQDVWNELATDDGWRVLDEWLSESREEDQHLDFKQANWCTRQSGKQDLSNDDRGNLAKTVSAFANSEGGVIVFGGITTKNARGKDRLTSLPGVARSIEYAEKAKAICQGITSPRVDGLQFRSIGHPTIADHGAVAIYIPSSNRGPHRAKCQEDDIDDRYFGRSGDSCYVLDHSMLAALFGTRPPPDLRIGFERHEGGKMRFLVENRGRGPARSPYIRIRLIGATARLMNITFRNLWQDETFTGTPTSVLFNSQPWTVVTSLPPGRLIYPRDAQLIAIAPLNIGEDFFLTLDLRIDCEHAQPIVWSGQVRIPAAGVAWIETDVEQDPL